MIRKLTEQDFIKMANKIYIEPTKEVIESIKQEFLSLEQDFNLLNDIDVTNIQPLTRISLPIIELREDEVDNSIILDKNKILNNAYDQDEDYVLMKRIVKK